MNNDIKEKPTPDNTIEIDVNKLKTSKIKLNKIFKEKDDWFIEYYDIKEILDKMERLIVYGQYNAYYDLEKQLLDYITNLQKEVNIITAESTEWESKCYDLQEENERLKRENYILKEYEDKKLNDYKSRNEKAIEYNYKLQERYCHSALYDELVASKIYEISEKNIKLLNGDDKND